MMARTLPQGVVVGIDGSVESRLALEWAAGEARLRQLPLQVVHAVDFPHSQLLASTGSDQSGELPGPRRIVDDAVAEVGRRWPDIAVTGHWRVGTPWTVLVREAANADLLVVGSRGHGRLGSILVGSVSTEVAQFARCPVLVVRESQSPGRRGVVVGVDASRASLRAVEFAFDEASRRGLPLTVAHAVWDPLVESQAVVSLLSRPERVIVDEAEMLDVAETIAGWRELYPDVEVDVRYENGRPVRVLADLADGAALLVVGSRGRGLATALLLGSVSRGALKYARCPVVIVRQRNSHHSGAGQRPTQRQAGEQR